VGHISVAESLSISSTTFTQYAPKATKFITLRYFTEFGKHTFQRVNAQSICGGIYAQVYCIL